MKRQQIHTVELIAPHLVSTEIYLKNSIKTLQTAVLLSLLEKGQLSKRQFDLCLEKMQGKDVQPYV